MLLYFLKISTIGNYNYEREYCIIVNEEVYLLNNYEDFTSHKVTTIRGLRMGEANFLRKKTLDFINLAKKIFNTDEELYKFLSDFGFLYGSLAIISGMLRFGGNIDDFKSHIIYLSEREAIVSKYIKEKTTVLDIGCGYGYLGVILVNKKKCTYIGVDIDEQRINVGLKFKELYKLGDRFKLVSIRSSKKLPFPDGYFDYVTYVWAFHDIDRKSWEVLLRENWRVLKPNGRILFYEPQVGLNFEEFMGILEKVGFTLIKKESFGPVFSHDKKTPALLLILRKK